MQLYLGPDDEQVRHVLDVVREEELGEVAGQLLAAEQGGGAHAAHQVGPLPGLADLQGVGQVVTAVCKQKQFIASKVQALHGLGGGGAIKPFDHC